MGFEPTTLTLARLCSTPELHPRSVVSEAPLEVRRRGPICLITGPIATAFFAHVTTWRKAGEIGGLPGELWQAQKGPERSTLL